MTLQATDIDRLSINTVRTLAIDAVQKAESGHPGMPLGAAPMAFVLWRYHLRFDPLAPGWPDRDRFVLSGGHGSMLLYALLHASGYSVTLDDLKSFRQWGSRTPGHPEAGHTPGVEVTTGPLGQGAANSVGLAIAERHLAHRFAREGQILVDHHTYAIVTDGDLMEGVAMEAAALAGHLGLGRLIWLYDSNDVTLDGPASLHMSEDMGARFAAMGWHVQKVQDGDDDLEAIDAAIVAAKAEGSRPSFIEVKTTIGFGSPKKAGTADAHGSPLGAAEVAATKAALGWPTDAFFHVPEAVTAHFRACGERGRSLREDWEQRFQRYARSFPEAAAAWEKAMALEPEVGFDGAGPTFAVGGSLATRVASGKVLNAFAAHVPFLLGGDADLSCSTKSSIDGAENFDGRTGAGRNIRFGVREHAMASIANGMSHHGGVLPYVSTFFCFADYMRPAMRLAALDGIPVVYVFTHDSVAVGEDGPTHQPVEHLMSLRVIPNLCVLRPGDAEETREAWRVALSRRDGPTALVLTRQNLPTWDRTGRGGATNVARGAYILQDVSSPAAIVIATGSEVHLALAASERLEAMGRAIRVVSMPSWELFAAQDEDYRESVLPRRITARVSIEAGTTFGWSRHVGDRGLTLGIDRFGASAPGPIVLEKLGMTVDAIVDAVESVISNA